MSSAERNPISPDCLCFNCRYTVNGKATNSPCCVDTRLVVTTSEYLRLFLDFYKNGKIDVEEVYPTIDQPFMLFIIHVIGACPHLLASGLCGVYTERPQCCVDAEPGKFGLCCHAPENRYGSSKIINIDDIP